MHPGTDDQMKVLGVKTQPRNARSCNERPMAQVCLLRIHKGAGVPSDIELLQPVSVLSCLPST